MLALHCYSDSPWCNQGLVRWLPPFAPGEIYRAMYFLRLGCFLLMRIAKSGHHNRWVREFRVLFCVEFPLTCRRYVAAYRGPRSAGIRYFGLSADLCVLLFR